MGNVTKGCLLENKNKNFYVYLVFLCEIRVLHQCIMVFCVAAIYLKIYEKQKRAGLACSKPGFDSQCQNELLMGAITITMVGY